MHTLSAYSCSGSSYEDLLRSSKVDSLRRVPGMQQNRADSRRWEVGVRTAHGSLVTLQLLLPDRFPNEAPVVHIVERGVVHSWLDRDQRVVGCHALNTWSCVTSDPGEVGGCPPPHTHTLLVNKHVAYITFHKLHKSSGCP